MGLTHATEPSTPAAVRRGHTPAWVWAASLGPAILVVAVAALQPWVGTDRLFRDTLAVAVEVDDGDFPPYLGFVSTIGGLAWWSGAAVTLAAAAAARNRVGRSETFWFLLCGGALTALLALDDLFLGHEEIVPRLFGFGERAAFAGYGVLGVAYLWRFRRIIWRLGPDLLALALVLFAASVAVDVFTPAGEDHYVAEDGFKALGIAAWTGFHLRASWLLVVDGATSAEPRRPA